MKKMILATILVLVSACEYKQKEEEPKFDWAGNCAPRASFYFVDTEGVRHANNDTTGELVIDTKGEEFDVVVKFENDWKVSQTFDLPLIVKDENGDLQTTVTPTLSEDQTQINFKGKLIPTEKKDLNTWPAIAFLKGDESCPAVIKVRFQ